MNNPILVFDIETIPDVLSGKRIYSQLADLPDNEALSALIALREEEAQTPFMRLPLHKIACLSVLWVEPIKRQLHLRSLSLESFNEADILNTFFKAFYRENLPNLVSWNGGGFDLPVILYRAMHHRLSAPPLFNDSWFNDYKYNNYLNRYHNRHLDLMDKLSLHGASTRQALDIVSGVCGFAGKQDIDGSMVVDLVNNQDWQTLTTYCESDVLNTWLLYLRWQLLTGAMTSDVVDGWEKLTHDFLGQLKNVDNSIRHQGFLNGWQFIQT